MDLVRTGGDGRERIGGGQAAIVVTMPVDADFFAGRIHHFVDGEFHEVERAVGRGVADSVAENDGAAPFRMAVEYSRLTVSGSVRMVSSVTYMDGRPLSTANLTAFSVVRSRCSTVQSSTRRRIGLEPRNVAASMAMPTACDTSTMGRISFSRVRAAQLGLMFIRCVAISRASASVCA